LLLVDPRGFSRKVHEQRKLARAKLNGYPSEGGDASQRVHREQAVRQHGGAIDEAVPATHERAHPREQGSISTLNPAL
jgi:hypothetical protein